MYENTWECGELELYFSPSVGGLQKKCESTRGKMSSSLLAIKVKARTAVVGEGGQEPAW